MLQHTLDICGSGKQLVVLLCILHSLRHKISIVATCVLLCLGYLDADASLWNTSKVCDTNPAGTKTLPAKLSIMENCPRHLK